MSKIVYEVIVNDGRDGNTKWYLDGKLHREDGPAAEFENGTKFWYLNDELHREDGPACEYAGTLEYPDGTKKWMMNGKFHREDGPAIIYSGGDNYWYLDDISYTKKEFDKEIARRKNPCHGKVVEIDGNKYKLTSL